MANYSELELRYARPVAERLIESGAFRSWFLAGTRFQGDYLNALTIGDVQRGLRSPKMTNPFWFNYFCGRNSKCACKVGTGIETDILLLFERPDGRRLALHIEIKRPGEHLGDGQAKSYSRRAACWANPLTRSKTVPPHQDYLTALVCGRELASDKRLGCFDKVVFHDEIAGHFTTYPEAAPAAPTRPSAGA